MNTQQAKRLPVADVLARLGYPGLFMTRPPVLRHCADLVYMVEDTSRVRL